jgi:asparagine synthase (glutamine-hydrolysing)
MGEDCPEAFRGQFAFAVWDAVHRHLFLARDRLGIKPLYYAITDQRFIFASEIKAILTILPRTPELGIEGLNKYLCMGHSWGRDTLFDGIHKLEPGTVLSVADNGTTNTRRYWNLRDTVAQAPHFPAGDHKEIRGLVEDAVNLRMISDVPLGAFLSGGLDSSITVGLMSRHSTRPVETFSVRFRGEAYDESGYANLVSRRFSTSHHTLFGEDDTEEVLEKVVWHLDEPLADAATIPTFTMSRLTRDFVTVVLSGDGADEIFAGYNKTLLLSENLLSFYPVEARTQCEVQSTRVGSTLTESPACVQPSRGQGRRRFVQGSHER